MEKSENLTGQVGEKLSYSEFINPALKTLKIDTESLAKRCKDDYRILDRIKKAENIAKELEEKELGHVKADANFAMTLETILSSRKRAEILHQKLKGEIIILARAGFTTCSFVLRIVC